MSKLREYRQRQGISQEEFAKSVKCKKSTISRLETGERVPSFALAERITKKTKGEVTPNDFLQMTVLG